MVTAPSRPLVHSYDPGKDPMELVTTPLGDIMERWRADALLVGETSALTELIKQVHNDAVEEIADIEAREAKCAAREEACDARERAFGVTAANVVNFIGRAAALFDKLQEARADAKREAEPLALPPDNQGKLEDAVLPGEHTPGGELHVIPAKDLSSKASLRRQQMNFLPVARCTSKHQSPSPLRRTKPSFPTRSCRNLRSNSNQPLLNLIRTKS
jgi:hypothetical protein